MKYLKKFYSWELMRTFMFIVVAGLLLAAAASLINGVPAIPLVCLTTVPFGFIAAYQIYTYNMSETSFGVAMLVQGFVTLLGSMLLTYSYTL